MTAPGSTVEQPTARARSTGGTLRISEIFRSLQGEARHAGRPTAFVRLTGCPLRCIWCDTGYAFYGGERMSVDEVLAHVEGFGTPLVCVTGGEPLAQKSCRSLLSALCERGFDVSLETSGALDIAGLDPRVTVVMDVKTPGSGEASRNRRENLALLRSMDQAKFVISDRADYEWAIALVVEEALHERCEVLFSPAWQRLPAVELAEWILEDRFPVRLQLQLHKLLWGETPGR